MSSLFSFPMDWLIPIAIGGIIGCIIIALITDSNDDMDI